MQVIQSSIQDGSPYYFTKEERFADPPPFLDETPVEPDPEPVIIQEGEPSMILPNHRNAWMLNLLQTVYRLTTLTTSRRFMASRHVSPTT
jgi:hypothetical protein